MTWQHILTAAIWFLVALSYYLGDWDTALICLISAYVGMWKQLNERLD